MKKPRFERASTAVESGSATPYRSQRGFVNVALHVGAAFLTIVLPPQLLDERPAPGSTLHPLAQP